MNTSLTNILEETVVPLAQDLDLKPTPKKTLKMTTIKSWLTAVSKDYLLGVLYFNFYQSQSRDHASIPTLNIYPEFDGADFSELHLALSEKAELNYFEFTKGIWFAYQEQATLLA